MKKFVTGLVSALVLLGVASCGVFVSEDSTKKAVEKQGYRDVVILAKHIFFVYWQGCGRDDDIVFDANAINVVGQRVDITICAGWPFKGVTIRTK